jgi:hypothetical protein
MKFYSLTCTRGGPLSDTTTNLLEYFKKCSVESKLLVDKPSIFTAYDEGLDEIDADFDDIIILCHDDIQILTDPKLFTSILKENLSKRNAGFVGVAGASIFTKSGVWWEQEIWDKGGLTGQAMHGKLSENDLTHFGPYREAVVLDGVFLATTKRVLRSLQLKKPRSFTGDWDFYDIFYTFQAHIKGKVNATIPINICHESRGELVGRDSWYQNKDAFVKKFSTYLPAQIKRRKP